MLLSRSSAIDDDRLPGDKRGGIRAQEFDYAGNVFAAAEPSYWRAVRDLLFLLCRQSMGHLRFQKSRRNRVHGDSPGYEGGRAKLRVNPSSPALVRE